MGVPQTGKIIILVVEDEALLRLNAIEIFEDMGCQVLQAANADDALVILAARDDIRIVFTDIQMPGSMDGLKLAAAVRDRWPPIHLIVTSGQMRPKADDLPKGGIFLPKPYGAAQLHSAMDALAL